jgi:hypothetical protein
LILFSLAYRSGIYLWSTALNPLNSTFFG